MAVGVDDVHVSTAIDVFFSLSLPTSCLSQAIWDARRGTDVFDGLAFAILLRDHPYHPFHICMYLRTTTVDNNVNCHRHCIFHLFLSMLYYINSFGICTIRLSI